MFDSFIWFVDFGSKQNKKKNQEWVFWRFCFLILLCEASLFDACIPLIPTAAVYIHSLIYLKKSFCLYIHIFFELIFFLFGILVLVEALTHTLFEFFNCIFVGVCGVCECECACVCSRFNFYYTFCSVFTSNELFHICTHQFFLNSFLLSPHSLSLSISLAIAFLYLPPGTHIFSLSAVASSPDGSKSKSDNTAADASDQRAEPIKSTSDNSSPVDETTPESIERKQSAPTTPLPTPPPPLPLNGVISSKYTIYFVRRKRMNESLHFSIKQAHSTQTHPHT